MSSGLKSVFQCDSRRLGVLPRPPLPPLETLGQEDHPPHHSPHSSPQQEEKLKQEELCSRG